MSYKLNQSVFPILSPKISETIHHLRILFHENVFASQNAGFWGCSIDQIGDWSCKGANNLLKSMTLEEEENPYEEI